MNPPANWYPDPTGRHGQRYWDGTAWTEHVFTDGVQATDPLETATPIGGGVAEGEAQTAAATSTTTSTTVDEPQPVEEASPAVVEEASPAVVEEASPAVVEEPEPAEEEPASVTRDDAPAVDEADGDDGQAVRDLWADAGSPAADDAAVWGDDGGAEDGVEEVADPPPAADLADAFVLAPETRSRLVQQRAAVDVSTAEEPTPDPEPAPAATGDARPPSGVIDAPPPTVASSASPADLGISGDLVGGAFAEREDAGPVALQNSRLLRCRVGGSTEVVARQGTMVAYQGEVTFERQGAGSVSRALKRAATGEGLAMMRIGGHGDVFFADGAQHVFILHLSGGAGLSVNGRNVLAFDASLHWDIERVKGATLLAGGLFNTSFTGSGWVALCADGEPVVLRTDDAATYVDVNALVAWSGGLSTRIVNTVSAKSLVGLGSGEAFQMAFDGTGIVVVQPSEGPMGGAGAS